ncbi:GNAT family N-acetyltransferase [Ideonella sp.]|jgi:ribosomal protein S18 acetylase RimI-like enzyme|uniref:GNAT family N-acetyltransferase n=1 Tax=Ideonella sp. TaxID=1929293 RepID=UPI0037BF45BA
MTVADYEAVMALMISTPGVSFRDADSRDATARHLERNPGLSFVAVVEDQIVGCIMSGHDGRRGYLQHLVVHPNHRRSGLGKQLVEACLQGLATLGIAKSHIDVFRTNTLGQKFWEATGWKVRDDIVRFSFIQGTSENA